MVYVIAGNNEQFERYLKNRSIPRHEGRCIVGPIDLMAVGPGETVILTGTYQHRLNWDDLKACITQKKIDTREDAY